MPEVLPRDERYAGFADRTAAFIMDAIIVSTIFFYLLESAVYAGNFIGPLLFSQSAAAFNEPAMPVIIGSAVAGVVILVCLCWLYSAGVTSSRYSGTFGKMIMGMTVVDTSGNTLSFWHATVRFIAKIFSGLILFIGFFMIHFSPVKQGLHDRFAGTYVIYAKKAVPVDTDAGPTIVKAVTAAEEKKAEESRKNTKNAVIWLIAIPIIFIGVTVILAAIIAAFVFGMAGNVAHSYVVAATVQQPDADTIIVTYHGGQDAAELTFLEVIVNDNQPVPWDSPGIGEQKVVKKGTVGKDHVLVTGQFTRGERQVILDTWL
jgi:uncharacterized RDD family membrane protein YckC/FlaG/FlaF family flagellin (archaellin)